MKLPVPDPEENQRLTPVLPLGAQNYAQNAEKIYKNRY
jgi:hypothetical protein